MVAVSRQRTDLTPRALYVEMYGFADEQPAISSACRKLDRHASVLLPQRRQTQPVTFRVMVKAGEK